MGIFSVKTFHKKNKNLDKQTKTEIFPSSVSRVKYVHKSNGAPGWDEFKRVLNPNNYEVAKPLHNKFWPRNRPVFQNKVNVATYLRMTAGQEKPAGGVLKF